MTPSVLTIGHSNHPLERFIELLLTYDVTAIADVRSSPYSRLHPQFGREFLKAQLKSSSISYVFLGHELGARPTDPTCYEQGKVRYRRLAEAANFREGLQRVIRGAEASRVALLCAEKEPLSCHRALLVARELETLGVPVGHILANGKLESHSESMARLLESLGMFNQHLFQTNEELLANAYALQEQRVAYFDDEMRLDELHEDFHNRVY